VQEEGHEGIEPGPLGGVSMYGQVTVDLIESGVASLADLMVAMAAGMVAVIVVAMAVAMAAAMVAAMAVLMAAAMAAAMAASTSE
jgi:hypothetical protein